MSTIAETPKRSPTLVGTRADGSPFNPMDDLYTASPSHAPLPFMPGPTAWQQDPLRDVYGEDARPLGQQVQEALASVAQMFSIWLWQMVRRRPWPGAGGNASV